MGRLFLIALFVVVAVLINPTMRTKAMPYIQPALDPAYEMMARTRLKDIAKSMEAQAAVGRALPTEKTIGAFLKERYATSDAAVDPWGTPYFVKPKHDRVIVASAGPDRKKGTADDILSPAVIARKR
jgi:hypothetical protein